MKIRLLLIALLIVSHSFAQYDIQALLKTGVDDIIDSRYENALRKFNTILTVKPENWEAFFLRGVTKFYLGDYYGAQDDLSLGIAVNPYYSELYLFRGASYQLVSDYSNAIHDYKKCIELDPANPSCYVNYGVILMIKNNFKAALEQYNLALEVDKTYHDANMYRALCYVELKNYDKAMKDFSIALKENKFEQKIFIWRGKMYYDMEEYDKAFDEFDHALKLDSNNPLIFYYRGVASYELGNIENALNDFDKVLELDPLNALVFYNRAILRSEIGLNSKAIEDYHASIELNPNNILSHYNLGILYLSEGDNINAQRCFTNAIAIYENFYFAYLARAETFYNLDKKKNAIADQLIAQKIKKQNADKMYSDSASFSKVVAFDADFVKRTEKDLFISKKLMQKDADLKLSEEFILAYKCDSLTGKEYFNEFIDSFNKIYSSNITYSFINYKCVDSTQYETAIDTSSDPLIQLLNRGIDEALADNFNSSIDLFDHLIYKDSTFIAAYFNRAWVRSSIINMLKSFDDFPSEVSVSSKKLQYKTPSGINNKKIYHDYYTVLADYTRVIELAPTLFYAWYNRANTNMKLYKYSDALEDYSQSIKINPEFSDAFFNRGIAYLYVSDTTNACKDFGKAGELGISDVYPLLRKICK